MLNSCSEHRAGEVLPLLTENVDRRRPEQRRRIRIRETSRLQSLTTVGSWPSLTAEGTTTNGCHAIHCGRR
jgi:hypothetical protein